MKEIKVDKLVIMKDLGLAHAETDDLSVFKDEINAVSIKGILVESDSKCIWFKWATVIWDDDKKEVHFYFDKDKTIMRKNRSELLKEIL